MHFADLRKTHAQQWLDRREGARQQPQQHYHQEQMLTFRTSAGGFAALSLCMRTDSSSSSSSSGSLTRPLCLPADDVPHMEAACRKDGFNIHYSTSHKICADSNLFEYQPVSSSAYPLRTAHHKCKEEPSNSSVLQFELTANRSFGLHVARTWPAAECHGILSYSEHIPPPAHVHRAIHVAGRHCRLCSAFHKQPIPTFYC